MLCVVSRAMISCQGEGMTTAKASQGIYDTYAVADCMGTFIPDHANYFAVSGSSSLRAARGYLSVAASEGEL